MFTRSLENISRNDGNCNESGEFGDAGDVSSVSSVSVRAILEVRIGRCVSLEKRKKTASQHFRGFLDTHNVEYGGSYIGEESDNFVFLLHKNSVGFFTMVGGGDKPKRDGIGGMLRIALSRLEVARFFRVAVIGGDEYASPGAQNGGNEFGKAGVDVLNGFDRCRFDAGVSHHVRPGVVHEDKVVVVSIELFDDFVGDFVGAHFRLLVKAGDDGGGNENVIFIGPSVLATAVKEVCYVCVFFRFGDAELFFILSAQGFSEGVANALRREGYFDRKIFFILDHGNHFHLWVDGAFEFGEVGKGYDFRDFTRAIFAKIEENNAVSVGESGDGFFCLWVDDATRLDKFVADIFLVAGLQVIRDVYNGFANAFGKEFIGLLDAIPVVVSVHGPVTTDDACDRSHTVFFEAILKFSDDFGASLRRRVASVGKKMKEKFFGFASFGKFEEGVEMFDVGMNGALSHHADKMHGGIVFFDVLKGFDEGKVAKKRSVLRGERDAGHVLVDDASRAKCDVSHFAVSRFSPGKTDGGAGGLDKGEGIVAIKFVDSGFFGVANGISLVGSTLAPSVKNNKNNRFVRHIFSFYDVFYSVPCSQCFDKRGVRYILEG